MIKIIKKIGLAIKIGDIIYDIHPGEFPGEVSSFEVVKIDPLNNDLILKALNQMAWMAYIPQNDEFKFPITTDHKGWYVAELKY